MKNLLRILSILTVVTMFGACAADTAEKKETTIVFGDVSWDSVQVHNRIVAFIIENGFEGYKADFIPGDTMPIINGLMQGDVDVDMESWHGNVSEIYEKGIASGTLIDLGKNMLDAPQGWWVPRYLVEGDGALAPNLKSVKDLAQYAHLFKDPEDPSKGIVYGGVAGWGQLIISEGIFNDNGLGDTFNFGIAGSNAALAGSMTGAYKKGEPWVGYYWAPTAIMGKLDMVRLEGSEYHAALVHVLVNKDMPEKAPEVVEMLKKYSTTVDDNNEFLSQMDDNDWSTEETAKWFIENKEEVWTKWISPEAAKKVKAAL